MTPFEILVIFMKIHIISNNGHGLNNPMKIHKLKNYIKFLQPACNIMLLQGHKLNNTATRELGRSLWPKAACFVVEAKPGYVLCPDGVGRGGGSTS